MRWARLRFQIVGPLLASPADAGELKGRIEELAARAWRHPTTGESIRFSFKTIERWWYIARAASDPFAGARAQGPRAQRARIRASATRSPKRLRASTATIPDGSFQLHHDNLLAVRPRGSASGESSPVTRRSAAS